MTITVDTSLFDAMCNELAERAAKPGERVLREEVGKVLTKTIENTDAADENKIRRHSEQSTHTLQPASLYTPKRSGRRHLKNDRVLYNKSWRYPDTLWSSIQTKIGQDLTLRLRARGLAKRSWYRFGQLLGIRVEAPAYVKRAIARTGKIYPEDEHSSIVRSNTSVVFIIENSQPTVNAIHGARALQRAIDGRVLYFITNVNKGVFNEMATIARKYPGVFVTKL